MKLSLKDDNIQTKDIKIIKPYSEDVLINMKNILTSYTDDQIIDMLKNFNTFWVFFKNFIDYTYDVYSEEFKFPIKIDNSIVFETEKVPTFINDIFHRLMKMKAFKQNLIQQIKHDISERNIWWNNTLNTNFLKNLLLSE